MNNNTHRRHSTIAPSIVAVLAIVTLAGCSPARAASRPFDEADPIAVTAAPAAMADVAETIDAGGVVQALTTAAISARLLAPVREVRVVPGDQVRKGQTLIVLDGDDLSAAAGAARSAVTAAEQGAKAAAAELQAAEAALSLARASHDRIASLHTKRSATEQELDDAIAALRSAEARAAGASARILQATSAIDSARAASDQAKTSASFATIAAPFDGLVTEKMVEPGNMASPGTPLLRLEDTRRFHLEVRVDEAHVPRIRNGDRVPVLIGVGSLPVEGIVVEVGRAVDADARASLVKIALPDITGLRSGEFGRARFPGMPRRALTVPPSAVVRRGQLTTVFVIDEGRARVRLINVRESEVVAGLTAAELIVVAPPAGLTDGRRVSVGGR